MEYAIKITYSWGNEEPLGNFGTFPTKEEAFKKICELAGQEAYVQNEEFAPDKTCSIHFDASEYAAELTYDGDNSICYYRVVPVRQGREPMTLERAKQLLNNLVEYVAVANNTSEQIEELQKYGFTPDELYEFGYSTVDIECYTGTAVDEGVGLIEVKQD